MSIRAPSQTAFSGSSEAKENWEQGTLETIQLLPKEIHSAVRNRAMELAGRKSKNSCTITQRHVAKAIAEVTQL